MLTRNHDPIIAVATAPGRGAVGIVRVSGKNLAAFVSALLGQALAPRYATYLPFKSAQGDAIDQGLALYFPAPHSYTGEDVLELQAHGGQVVLQLLVARCLEVAAKIESASDAGCLPGLRLAQPGEFTERAFLNDKIDLAQAEAIADLIDASTETAARSAARSLTGAFSLAVNGLLERLIRLRMLVEATLDFPEEDIDFLQQADAKGQLSTLQEDLATVAQRVTQGALLREGIKVVIAGQPNVGKSSLLNALAGAELAIVTPIAGTTRDKVSQLIQINGVPLHVVDTAGLRDAQDEVEKIGIERAWAEIQTADAIVLLHDLPRHAQTSTVLGAADGPADKGETDHHQANTYQAEDARILDTIHRHFGGGASTVKGQRAPELIHVWNKADLVDPAALAAPVQGLLVSAHTGAGLDALRSRLLAVAGWQNMADGVFMARQRHVQALANVGEQLSKAQAQLASTAPALDLLAEDLRQAQRYLGDITGQFSADDLLGEIFSTFCIGK